MVNTVFISHGSLWWLEVWMPVSDNTDGVSGIHLNVNVHYASY